jgi:hypothetical protein
MGNYAYYEIIGLSAISMGTDQPHQNLIVLKKKQSL